MRTVKPDKLSARDHMNRIKAHQVALRNAKGLPEVKAALDQFMQEMVGFFSEQDFEEQERLRGSVGGRRRSADQP